VIPIKFEFSASVGFIHKEVISLHGYEKESVPGFNPLEHIAGCETG
jgi:hypothetical protein